MGKISFGGRKALDAEEIPNNIDWVERAVEYRVET